MASLARLNRSLRVSSLLFNQKCIAQKRNFVKLTKINKNSGEICFSFRLSHISLNKENFPGALTFVRLQSTESAPKEDDYHSIIKNTEKPIG